MALSLTRITGAGRRLQTFRALRYPNFRWFWFNSMAQAAGQGMQFLVLGWLTLDLTDSASRLGLVIFMYGMPNLAFVALGGIFADRVDRRKLLISSQLAVTAVVLGIATLTITDQVAMRHIYGAAFLLGLIQALNMPARLAMVANLVERDDLMNAVSLNAAVMNSGRIAGPAVAGGIIELAGIGPALYLNAGCYLLATLFLSRVGKVGSREPSRSASIAGDLVAGLRYFVSAPVAFTIIGIGFAFGFFGMPHMQLLPAFAKEVLSSGAGGAGLLITASAIGSLLGSLALASMGNFKNKNWILLGAAFTFAVSLMLFAWSPWYWLSWVILVFVGLGSMSYVSLGTTVLQLSTPSEVQGRVLSLWTVGASLMFVGSLPMGVVADALNWKIAFSGGAGIFALVVLWLGVWRPTLRSLRL